MAIRLSRWGLVQILGVGATGRSSLRELPKIWDTPIRQAVDDNGAVVGYNEYDPYGNPLVNRKSEIVNPYGYTGEWYEGYIHLLHLRARWYSPSEGVFLSRDPVESEPAYQYVRGNPANRTDPSGNFPPLPNPNTIYQPGINFFSYMYDKTNSYWKCDKGDDGQYPTDGIYDFMRDFVCEFGETTREFHDNDYLTIQLRQSDGIEQARQNFFNHLTVWGLSPGGKVSGNRTFSYREFVDATVEALGIGLISHMLGSYSYDISIPSPKSGEQNRVYREKW